MSDALFVVVIAAVGAVAGWAMRPKLDSFEAPVARWLPAPEGATALLFGLAAGQYDDWRLVALLAFLWACVALSIIDLAQYRLPNKILFPAIAVVGLVITIGELADGHSERIVHMLVGAGVYFAILLFMHLINPAGMGFGDVKLAVLLGGVVGWVSGAKLDAVRAVMVALLIGSALGVVLGVGRILVTKLGGRFLPDPEEGSAGEGWHRTTFPFGPPLMVGAILVALYPATLLG